ncbi:hypothetical protein LHA31_05090 [Carnobacterium viridans]|uniref:Uncharacterized protein n=1 Tax=Carnobacterium viridans TaxID=174587 RepID=A0A1H1AQF3_9LACT|nr:hypothetical protein [Carnobacterium viridans]UDE96095.1 hypothetical protein LHA31_05090 [Carnobacterium viridans]SDQ41955.1 hypothetical protein SAMN04487752_2212 [Carnobacterium viridans]
MTDKLNKAIKDLPPFKREFVFFKYPHLRFFGSKVETEAQLMKATGRTTMGTFNKFERSAEFQRIEALILQQQVGKDIMEIYGKVKEKALSGDRLAVTDLLKLSKAIDQIVIKTDEAPAPVVEVVKVEVEEDFEDDLI